MFPSSFQRMGSSFCIGITRRYATRLMSTRTLSRVSVEALYKYRSNDVSKCMKQAMGDWPLDTYVPHLDKDWILFQIPTKWYVESCGGSLAGDEPVHDSVWACASRRGAVVVINSRPAGLPASVSPWEHPVFSLTQLLDAAGSPSLPQGAVPAREELPLLVGPSSGPGPSAATASEPRWCERLPGGLGGGNSRMPVEGNGSADSMGAGAGAGHAGAGAAPVLRLGSLEADAVRVISSCLAQSVNLQYFEGRVDRMQGQGTGMGVGPGLGAGSAGLSMGKGQGQQGQYAEAGDAGGDRASLSASILREGGLLARARKWVGEALEAGGGGGSAAVYRQLGAANEIASHVLLSGLRNTVRPGSTAWKDERFSTLQELLWEDQDLEERYEELERRLSFVTEGAKYELEVGKDAKSIFLERVIVALIAAELVLSSVSAGLPGQAMDFARGLLEGGGGGG